MTNIELPGAMYLFALILFSTAGFAALVYGKKTMQWKPMAIGVALMLYPYLVKPEWLFYLIGAALTAALFVFRD